MIIKDIPGYEGLYAATDDGRIWSHKRKKYLTAKIEKGYYRVSLTKDGKIKRYQVYHLVAMAFLPNTDGLTEISHKNGNRLDNSINNLVWVDITQKRKGSRRGKHNHITKPVYCDELDKTFNSIKEAAAELKVYTSNIIRVCKGQLKQTGGYHFKYAEKP
jgi:hypothetical protein